MTTTFRPLALTYSCMITSSRCCLRSSFSKTLRESFFGRTAESAPAPLSDPAATAATSFDPFFFPAFDDFFGIGSPRSALATV